MTTTIFNDAMQRRGGIPPSAYRCSLSAAAWKDFKPWIRGRVAASLAETPPYNFRSVEAGSRVLLNCSDKIKHSRIPGRGPWDTYADPAFISSK